MSSKKQVQSEIMEAYVFLRERNTSIPSETLEFMKDASIEKLNQVNKYVSAIEIIDYIENNASIAMPIDELMHEDGKHLTKKEYGLVLLKYLVKELKEVCV